MEDYDPNRDPDADEWLDLDEQERMILAEDYHRRHQISMPSVEGHAVIHAIVENQLASEDPVVVETFAFPQRVLGRNALSGCSLVSPCTRPGARSTLAQGRCACGGR